jgi:hypothetical protein
MWHLPTKRNRIALCTTLFCLYIAGATAVVAESANLDPPNPINHKTPVEHHAVAEDLAEMMATVTHARVSAPVQMAGLLQELRLESAVHLGRLDVEERSEMMMAMRGAGVALGDRNKLRLLAAEWRRDGAKPLPSLGSQRMRRAQQVRQDGQDESATNKQLKAQAEGHAGSAQPSGGQASSGTGISSDSASAHTICL